MFKFLTTQRYMRYVRAMFKTSTSYRLSAEARRIIAKLAKALGVSR